MLLQEFSLKIHDKKGAENVVADQLSKIVVKSVSDTLPVLETFPDEQLISVSPSTVLWYADIVNYLVTEQMPASLTKQERLHFLARIKWFFWDEPYLFKYCPDQIIRHCVPDLKFGNILSFCHDQACGDHFSRKKTATKLLQYDFYWPTLFCDAHVYCQSCDLC